VRDFVVSLTFFILSLSFFNYRSLPKFIIIASDGLWDVVRNQEACDFTKDKLKEQTFGARSLMKKAYARKSMDNITVILVKFTKPKVKKTPKPSFRYGDYDWLRND